MVLPYNMTVYQAVRQFGEQTDADTDTETPLGIYGLIQIFINSFILERQKFEQHNIILRHEHQYNNNTIISMANKFDLNYT